jgi:hypothetical protein
MSKKGRKFSPENDIIIKYVIKAFGGTPNLDKYAHDELDLTINILYCHNQPSIGLTSYSTIGLSDYPMMGVSGEFATRLELAGACETSVDFFPNILASAAFTVMRTGQIYYPGFVMSNVISQYMDTCMLSHLYLTAPFLWKDDLKTMDCGTKKVSWLLAMPIYESEYYYLKKYGDHKLEELFELHEIDIFNLNRQPVV